MICWLRGGMIMSAIFSYSRVFFSARTAPVRGSPSESKGSPRHSPTSHHSRKFSPFLYVLILILLTALMVLAWYLFMRPLPIHDGEPFQPEHSGFIPGGTYTIPSLIIPQGVTVKARGDLILNITGNADLSGVLRGNCVSLDINTSGNLTLTGNLENDCQKESSSDLSLRSEGGAISIGSDTYPAVIKTSGDLLISNEPAITSWDFDVLPAQRTASSFAPACSASASEIFGILDAEGVLPIAFSARGVDPDGGELNYAWDFGDGSTAGQDETIHEFNAAGSFPVVLTVTDNEGQTCIATLSVLIQAGDQQEQYPAPAVQVQPDTLVLGQGERFFLDASAFAPVGTQLKYAWNFGDDSISTDTHPSHTYDEPGLYLITLTVSYEGGAWSKATTLIYIYPSSATAQHTSSTIVMAAFNRNQKTIFPITFYKVSPFVGGNIRGWSSGDLIFRSFSGLETPTGHAGLPHGGSAGDIILYAQHDIIIEPDVILKAGDGGDGKSGDVSAGIGGNGGGIYINAGGSIYIDTNPTGSATSILAGNGGKGGSANGKYAFGGRGGNGGALFMQAFEGVLDIGENVTLQVGGDGGRGGDATDSAITDTWVQAGSGGRSGSFRLSGRSAEFAGVNLIIGSGGRGGDAYTDGIDGANKCTTAENGVNVSATAGRGGNAWGCSSTVDFDPLIPSTLTGGNAGDGGDATAIAGDGGTASCQREAIGGDGGNAYATAGKGGDVGLTTCTDPALKYLASSFTAGNGGVATANAGNGGKAEAIADTCGQYARAVGGDGGRSGAFGGHGGSHINDQAGLGGNANATTGIGGSALARGGDCLDDCADGGGAEARGGDAGNLFSIRGGSAGQGHKGQEGISTYTLGVGGNAEAYGGMGGTCSICPFGDGGDGGDASAYAGFGGYFEVQGKRAAGGSVDAQGGMGGEGATCCDPPDDAGNGGAGGDAFIQEQLSPTFFQLGGDGGDAGDGILPGEGGPAGHPNGMVGLDGNDCVGIDIDDFTEPPSDAEQGKGTTTPSIMEVIEEQATTQSATVSGSAPEILFIEFPEGTRQELRSATNNVEIPADGTHIKGVVGFRDPDDRISYAWFEPIQENTVFEGFGFYITDTDLEQGNFREGVFSFYIFCNQFSQEIFNVQLMDESGNWFSRGALFGFTCR